MQFQFRPVDRWPRQETRSPERARFKTPHSETLDLLLRELSHLRAKDLVIQAYVTDSQIRNDGMLYASARPSRPGVIISFASKHGPLSYPCDRFDNWQDNIRAIALSLEALRKVDRYGVTAQAEQYTGWRKLGGESAATQFTDVASAWQFIRDQAGSPTAEMEKDFKQVWSLAVRKWHPDVNPEGEKVFRQLVAAKQILDRRGGI